MELVIDGLFGGLDFSEFTILGSFGHVILGDIVLDLVCSRLRGRIPSLGAGLSEEAE